MMRYISTYMYIFGIYKCLTFQLVDIFLCSISHFWRKEYIYIYTHHVSLVMTQLTKSCIQAFQGFPINPLNRLVQFRFMFYCQEAVIIGIRVCSCPFMFTPILVRTLSLLHLHIPTLHVRAQFFIGFVFNDFVIKFWQKNKLRQHFFFVLNKS